MSVHTLLGRGLGGHREGRDDARMDGGAVPRVGQVHILRVALHADALLVIHNRVARLALLSTVPASVDAGHGRHGLRLGRVVGVGAFAG